MQWGFSLSLSTLKRLEETVLGVDLEGASTANLTYLTVPGAELEGISRIGRIPATQIDPTWFETINPLISRVRISWPTTLMYFSLVLTAGERSPLALRGLFPSLFLFFLEEKLVMDMRSLAQMKHGESRAVGLQFIWFSLSVQPPASLIHCCFMEKYSSASQLLHCTDCSSHKSSSILVALVNVTSGSWFVWRKSQTCLQRGMEIICAQYHLCHLYLTSQGVLVNYIRSAFVISGWCSWWRLEMMCLFH